ncbi:hypothetical protein BH10BAC5_BH10BAC5_19620 [soil metagenome]
MKKVIITLFLLFVCISCKNAHSQTLVNSYPFINNNVYNYFWGIANVNDTLWIGSDYDNTTTVPFSRLIKVLKNGTIVDSITTPFKFNHGLAWDGSAFWIAKDFTSSGAKIYRMSRQGVKLDSIQPGVYLQGIGGIAITGNFLWATCYYPDFPTYPFGYAYKFDLTTKLKVDSIPLRGAQVQGIAIKGDTILYVNDQFTGDPERIYAYRQATGDTLFSFPSPDPDGSCDPRGMVWDGQNLWLVAQRIGNNISSFSTLYKYTVTGQGSPQITTNAATINFGNVIVNTTSNQTLTITNTGTATLNLNSFNISNPRFGISPSSPDSILAGQFKNYTVSFNPLVYDTLTAFLDISSNDGGTPVKRVTLKGKGVLNGANINLSASSYDYSLRRVTCLSGFLFNITNTGSQPLSISAANFTTAAFKLDTTLVSFPIIIDTQKTRQFRVWFHPTSVAGYIDSLTLVSNAVNTPNARIRFTATAVNPPSALGERLWEGTVPANPNSGTSERKPISMKQITDVNGDGVNDMLVAASDYLVICYNGNSSVSSDILWTFNTGYNNNNSGSVTYDEAMQVRDDINGDGIKDVVIGCGGGNEEVYTISGRTGQKIWDFGDSVNFSNGDVNGVRVDKDYNGDGIKDVIFSASGTGSNPPGRKSVICLNGLTGAQLFAVPLPNTFMYDLCNSQNGFAVSEGNNGGPYAIEFYNNSGVLQWSHPSPDVVWSMKDIPSQNADTLRDIVAFAGFSGRITLINSANGATIWEQLNGQSINGDIRFSNEPNSYGILPKLSFYGAKQVSYIVPSTGVNMWTSSLDGSYIMGGDIIGYTNIASTHDYACGTLGNNFYILNGENGAVKFTYAFGNGSSTDFAVEKVARLDKLTLSSSNNVVAGSRDGRVKCFYGGNTIFPLISNISTVIPGKYSLEQNYPNPFNPETSINFDLPNSGLAKILIYDMSGREVISLVNEILPAGKYKVTFNAAQLSSGTYFYRMTSGSFIDSKKMVVIK